MCYKLVKTIVIFSMFASSCAAAPTKTACVNNVCINVEIADTPRKRAMGLMFRENMGENEGMLFIFEAEEAQGFWMKNMKFPLDIIWVSAYKRIIDINENIPPCQGQICESYASRERIKYAIEVNAGFVKKNSIKKGQEVSF